MATIKLYLDKRKKSKTNLYPLVIVLTAGTTKAHLPLEIKLEENQFNGQEIINHPRKKVLNDIAKLRLSEIQVELSSLAAKGLLKNKSANDIKKLLLPKDSQQEMPQKARFKTYFDTYIARQQKQATIDSHIYTFNRLAKYCDIDKLHFEDITVSFLRDFEVELSKTCSTNTRSIHFRNIRAVFNAAIDEEIVSQDHYPFRRFKIKSEQTQKRSLTLEALKTLRDYPCEPHQEVYRDMFMLSFYLAGINMVDLLSLPNFEGTLLAYRRAKTGIFVQFEMPQEALDIIDKYRGEEKLLYIGEKYKNHRDFVHRMNENLQRIGQTLKPTKIINGKRRVVYEYNPTFPELTSYWARHTWATIAADLDIPEATIDMALAHKSKYPMADIYIRRNMNKVTEAVNQVIQYVKK